MLKDFTDGWLHFWSTFHPRHSAIFVAGFGCAYAVACIIGAIASSTLGALWEAL